MPTLLCFMSRPMRSEAILQGELDLTVVSGGSGHPAEGAGAESASWIAKLRRVGDVKHFRAKQQGMLLFKGHTEHLGEGEIERVETRSDHGVSRRRAVRA